jgi:hypothetical protein
MVKLSGTRKDSTDVIQKKLWHYWELWAGILVVLFAARWLLPHLPLLKGWEQKLTTAAVEVGIGETPENASKVSTDEQILAGLPPKLASVALIDELKLNGPLAAGQWNCKILSEEGSCIRYLWKNEPLTMIVTVSPKRAKKNHGPFTKTGWSGYYVITKNLTYVLVGPFNPDEFISIWTLAQKAQYQPTK